jgi:methanogenic corrinoid protein MtbC1
MPNLNELSMAIEAGDRASAVRMTIAAVAQGTRPQAILDAMTIAMAEVGGRFQRNEIFVPEMLVAARAMKEATAVLEPNLVAADIASPGTRRRPTTAESQQASAKPARGATLPRK